MNGFLRRALITGLLGATLAGSVSARVITFHYEGTIVSVAALDPANPFPGPVDFGTPFAGSYSFESTAADAISSPSSGAFDSPLGVFSLTLAGLSLTFSGVTIVTANTPGFDFYGAQHAENPTDANPTGVLLQINLTGLSDTALSSDLLPLTPPTLSAFDTSNAFFFTDTLAGNQVEVGGTLDSLTCVGGCAPVPEPSSTALLGIGVAALAAARRRAHGPVRSV